jgi:hypothetical protein
LKILLEDVGPNSLQVNGNEFFEFYSLLLTAVFRTLEQAPSAAGQYCLLFLGLEFLEFSRPNFINLLQLERRCPIWYGMHQLSLSRKGALPILQETKHRQ